VVSEPRAGQRACCRRGELATYPGDLQCALSLGGLADLTHRDEPVDDVRAALRAYGQWLIQVTDKAH
jgi:hypothetical protein